MQKFKIYILIYFLLHLSVIPAEEHQSFKEWEGLLKELNKIEKIVSNTTVLQFRSGCSVIEESKNGKEEILSHRFDCLGEKVSVIYQGTFAIVFLEDQQEVRVIDLSLAKNELSIKNLITHILVKDSPGIASPLGPRLSPQIFSSMPAQITKNTAFHIIEWFRQHFNKPPVDKFTMNEFAANFRNSDISSGEGVGKLGIVFNKDKIKLAPNNFLSSGAKAVSFSVLPILGGYLSTFYIHVERGEMFHAGKTLKLIDDLINAHPEDLGFLKGHTLEDRKNSNLLLTEIAESSGINVNDLTKKLELAQDKKIQKRLLGSTNSFYKELHDTDVDIKHRQVEEELSKSKDRMGKLGYQAKKFATNNDSHYTAGDVYEDYIDKYARGPLSRINPLINLFSAGILFRNESVYAGYLAENYYRQNQKDLYNKAIAMPADGIEFLPDFMSAKNSIRNAQSIFAKNLCPSLDKSLQLSDDEKIKLKQVQDSVDEVGDLFSHKEKRFLGSRDVGLVEDYHLAMKALDGKPNNEKGMKYLANGFRKLELAASKILALQRELGSLSPNSPKYQAEHLRVTKLMSEWAQWNGVIREQMDKVIGQNLSLGKSGKKLTELPADLAYLYSRDPSSLDLSPGGPKESYLELNRWFTESKNFPAQISKSLSSGKVEFAPPAALLDAAYSPNYKVFERVESDPNLMKLKYTTNFSTEDYKKFQENAMNAYRNKRR